MGCSCKVGQQIAFLEKHYGMIERSHKETSVGESIKNGIRNALILMLLLPVYLIFCLIILFRPKSKGSISIKKMFRLEKV